MEVLRYQCGCDADTVGQAFEDGVILCPEHRRGLEPGPPPPPMWRGQITVTVEVELTDRRIAERWFDDLSDELARHDWIKTSTATIEEQT